jgi:hypothetical protein
LGFFGPYKAVDDPVAGVRRDAIWREMVYDSFVTGRPVRPFRKRWI